MSNFHNHSTGMMSINLANFEEVLFFEEVLVVNANFETSVSHMLCFLATVTIVTGVNIMALMWVKVKDKVLIDKMVTLDCVANIMMVGVLLLAFPVRIWNNDWLCAGITFFRSLTANLNR